MASKYKKRPDGYYMANVIIGHDEKGKRIYAPSIYARTIRELEEKKAEVKNAVSNGTYADDKKMTVGKWAEKWLEIYKKNKSPATYRNYKNSIKNLEPIKDIRLKELRKSDVLLAINALNDKPDTQRMLKITINQMLEDAIDDGLVSKNVARKIKLPEFKRPEKRALSEKELRAISRCDFTPKENAFLQLLYYTGIRMSEALALTRNDIDFAEGYVDINKAITWASEMEKIKLKDPKSEASIRKVVMPEALSNVLRAYISTLDGIYLFPMLTRPGLMTQDGYRRFWDRIRNKINAELGGRNKRMVEGKILDKGLYVTDITAHMFRHNYATMLYDNKVDVKEAQVLLGHANISVTLDVYTHIEKSKLKTSVSDKLNSFRAIM